MPALRIQTNMPEEVRLLSIEGEIAPSSFGADQLRYRTDKGDLYVSPAVAKIFDAAIAAQQIQPGEPVVIAKLEASLGNGRKSIRWSMDRAGTSHGARRERSDTMPIGEQPDGTFAVPRIGPQAEAAAPVQSTALNYTMTLIDAYAAAVRYANDKHSGVVTPERVWSIFATVVIGQQQRNGGKSYAA